jgi:alkanesulfonate monooxygenase SsuD/methylene tetrahydromethanopterin reductase-like flavin-dependent oxidoreductase (luciferase family)
VGETQEEAERLAMPVRAVFKLRRQPERIMVDRLSDLDEAIAVMGGMIPAETATWPAYVVGTPERVKMALMRMAEETGVNEFMIQDFLDDQALRVRNYALLARAFDLSAG